MINWYWSKFLQYLGYRKMWYFPSNHGIALGDFSRWEYRPDLEPGEYKRD